MKPSDKQLAAGVKAFNECDIVSTPHCISAAYDAMTEAMTVEDVPERVRREIEVAILSEVKIKMAPGTKVKFPDGFDIRFSERF